MGVWRGRLLTENILMDWWPGELEDGFDVERIGISEAKEVYTAGEQVESK